MEKNALKYEIKAQGTIKGDPPIFEVGFVDCDMPGKVVTVRIGAQGVFSTVASWLAKLGFWTYRVTIKEPGGEVVSATGLRGTCCSFDFSHPPPSEKY